jgi:hypothetical protein
VTTFRALSVNAVKTKLYRYACLLSLLTALLVAVLWIRSYFRCDWAVHAQATLPFDPGFSMLGFPNDATGGRMDPSLHGVIVGSGGVTFYVVRNLPDGLSRVRFADAPFTDGWHVGSDPDPTYPDMSGLIAASVSRPADTLYGNQFCFSYVFFNAFHRSSSGVAFITLPFWFVMLWTLILPGRWVVRRFRTIRATSSVSPRCKNCGYDVRASPERCPECGHARNGV